ncbi:MULTISPECIES: FkbM family methyltransferase [Methylobacterium]|uniref:FkbM family methyltransferase n=1 Tax=Methylobacterium TaxID=407 RepID=UPI0013EA6C0A|nr:FkbM family methyltransferase [Methylobacterium sp. DB0501]NGM35688.1 FkbM family methyltransferase [Methylobacterium sp. DB0501]
MTQKQPPLRTLRALHPNWTGHLDLYPDGIVVHREHGDRGTYTLDDGIMAIEWNRHGADRYVAHGDIYMQHGIEPVDLGALNWVSLRKELFRASGLRVRLPGTGYEVAIRLGTTDMAVFEQVFVAREYESAALPSSARTIIDLGANVGYASIYFGLRYPEASITMVEPDRANLDAAIENTRALGPRVTAHHAAIWSDDGVVSLRRQGEDGASLESWGFQTSRNAVPDGEVVPSMTMSSIMRASGCAEVDILKVDIEGAEIELMSDGDTGWLSAVGMIIVETHDRFRPGSDAAVRGALATLFEELPPQGENLIFRRKERR